MADLTAMLQAAAGQVGGEYQISRSLRFNSADSAYLSRTPASASNRKTWTWSGWVKRTTLSSTGTLFAAGASSVANLYVLQTVGNQLAVRMDQEVSANITTTQVFRDVSAWYHFVIAVDTAQATGSNRVKIYVNGLQITAFDDSNYPSQDFLTAINNNVAHEIGLRGYGPDLYLNSYLTEINFIDGQQLTPTSFGEANETTGVWSPIAYAGSYGTNGFYLNFSDNSDVTAATLGADYSGNGNNWTPSGFSVTAGAGNDSLVDVPTRNTEDVDTGAGGEVRGNYATLNPLRSKNSPTFSQGNMRVTDTTPAFGMTITTIPPVSGDKIYGEATVASNTSGASVVGFGFTDVASGAALPDPGDANLYIFYGNANGNIYNGASLVTSGLGAPTAGTVLQVAYDKSNGYAWVGKANTWYDSTGGSTGDPSAGTNPTFTLTSNNLNFYVMAYNNSLDINFGQRPFAHTAPSGFKALVTTNLPEPTVVQGDDYFNTVLYDGTGSSQSITTVGFVPDFTWIKEKNAAADHALYDAVRGVTKQLESNTDTAETTEATGLTAFVTGGFTVGALAQVNTSGDNYVAWNWKADGAGVSNTAGTITGTVTVSANTIAGISIVTYTGNGVAGATVGHGLGAAPAMMFGRSRSNGGAGWQWRVYHKDTGPTKYLGLNETAAAVTSSAFWNDTAPTSTVFSLGSDGVVNQNSGTFVMYCFAEVEGFSKFGSYTGNGSTNGPFVYTGFRPAWVMIKISSTTGDWLLYDNKRNSFNVVNAILYPNLSDAEAVSGGGATLDFVSNGFKLRGSGSGFNDSGATFVYACFASNPFKYSLAR
jgi:hypothetical protein